MLSWLYPGQQNCSHEVQINFNACQSADIPEQDQQNFLPHFSQADEDPVTQWSLQVTQHSVLFVAEINC